MAVSSMRMSSGSGNDFSNKNKKVLTDFQAEFSRFRKYNNQNKNQKGAGYSSSGGSTSSGYSSNESERVHMRGES